MFKAAGKILTSLFGNPPSDAPAFHPAGKCRECGTPLMRTALRAEWHCPNLDCPAQIRARIAHWCSPAAMDIPGADAELVKLLVERGLVRDVAELYRLKVKELAALPGMDRDSARKFFDAITASQKREAWRLLFGLNMPQVSDADARSLCAHFGSADNVLAAGAERLAQAPNISLETARSIAHWHGDAVNRRLVKNLFKAGLNFKIAPQPGADFDKAKTA